MVGTHLANFNLSATLPPLTAPFEHPLRHMGNILVINASSKHVQVFVSAYSNKTGDDSWCTLPAGGGRDSWGRCGWEFIAFKNDAGSRRAGVYVPANSVVTFHDFGDISIE
ncbi:hypothetical protein V5O48_007689 [Marasmius crinis-equi]|uniref:Uncharacterized protein n=1 Tax=Marasmius crinis-equi TaxID=585013 RepID=A0ABR3FFY0_9AGAR